MRYNGYEVAASKKEIINFTLGVDTKNLSLEEIAVWLEKHTRPVDFLF